MRLWSLHPKFLDSHNVLVDDLQYREHLGYSGVSYKVEFLNMLPKQQYIEVKPFTVWGEKLDNESEYLEDLKNRIKEVLN